MAAEKYFDGEGEFRQVKPGRHQWETCFVPELVNFELPPWVARGAAGNNIQFLLGDSSMHCHISQFFEGTYKKAHAHNSGAHIFCVTGEGYSLLWKEGENPVDTVRVDWKPGTLYAPPDGRGPAHPRALRGRTVQARPEVAHARVHPDPGVRSCLRASSTGNLNIIFPALRLSASAGELAGVILQRVTPSA